MNEMSLIEEEECEEIHIKKVRKENSDLRHLLSLSWAFGLK